MNILVRTKRMEPNAQRNVDIAWVESSVTTSMELVTMDVIQGFIKETATKNVLRNCTEKIVSKTAVNIVTYPRLVTTRPVPVKGVALMGGNCLCVKKNVRTIGTEEIAAIRAVIV